MLDIVSVGSKTTLTLFIGLLTIQCAMGLYDIQVYRLLGYEENGVTYGSKIASLNFMASHFTGNLLRKMAVIHFNEINEENLSLITKQKTTGLLIILPTDKLPRDAEEAVWKSISQSLLSKIHHMPVYFCWENETVTRVYNLLAANVRGAEAKAKESEEEESNYHFIVNTDEPKLQGSLAIDDFFGLLDESQVAKGSSSSNPIILVVASYDTFSIVPDLRAGLNEYASGAIALLNIARHLSQFYEQNHKLKYNVLFYLTGSRTYDYEGLNIWMSRPENSKVVSRIETAIFLDSLGSNDTLNVNLYNTEELEHDFLQGEIIERFNQTTKLYDIRTNLAKIAKPVFHKKFPVIKISTDKDENLVDNNQPLLDWHFDEKRCERNILFLTEFLIKSAYNIKKEFPVFDHNYIDHEYMKTAVAFFQNRSRFPTAITKDSAFSQDLFQAFSEVTKQPSKSTYTYSSPKFYTSKPAKLSVTRTSSPFMDLYIFGAVLAFLWVLYTVLSSFGTSTGESVKEDGGSGRASREVSSGKTKSVRDSSGKAKSS